MKKFTIVILLLSFLSTYSYSAQYNGDDIDGITYDCTAFSYETGNYYYVSVIFYGDEAQLIFNNGGYITIVLDDEVIEDPSDISAFDFNKGSYWILDIT